MQAVGRIVQDKVSMSSPRSMSVNCDGPTSAIALNKDASQVVVGGRTVFKIYTIDDDGFEEKHNLRVGKHINLNYCVTDIAWNHTEDNILATGATNGAVVIWDINRQSRSKQDTVFHEHKRTVHRVCFHENEHRLLLTASTDGSVRLFDIRKKDGQSLTFSSGSTSVKDVQFCPYNLSYFTFASADDGGNIHFWDYRRPDKVEKQFTAHGGPVFSIDWHPEERNWFATAGRDKMIKIWDLSNAKNLYTIYSIDSVTRVRWRPQRRFHIASCALLVDCSINIWDIRRPFVPFATFDTHKNVTTSIAFKNKDPHILLSGSKDSTLCQHVFRDAKRPGEHLVPAGLDLNVFGNIGHANSDRQGKMDAAETGGSRLAGYLPGGKKPVEKNDNFVDVASYLQVYKNGEQVKQYLSLGWLVEAAKRYKLVGHNFEDLCHHNAKIAQELDRPQVSQCWMTLLTLYMSHAASTVTHPQKPASGHGSTIDTKTVMKGKQEMVFDTDIDDKGVEGTSGNSDEETDDKEFETKLANIARGQVSPDWDIFFGDGEMGSYDLGLDMGSNKQESWILPREAFQPRHEIHDREAPMEALQHGPDTQHEVENEEAVVKSSGKEARMSSSMIITTDTSHMKQAEWEYASLVVDMLKCFAAEGDVQTPVCVLIVMKDKIRPYVDVDLQEDWFLTYIDLLGRFKLWSVANDVIKLSKIPGVAMLNQQSTTIHVNCNTCSKPLKRAGWLCERCKTITNKCCICHLPVKGIFLWCQGCSHGGHAQHVKDWFSRNIECPTGCGHICEYT